MSDSQTEFAVEVGADILKVSQRPDTRSFFDKLAGVKPPPEGEFLVAGIQQMRTVVQQTEGWVLPSIRFTDNTSIPANNVVIRVPGGSFQCEVTNLNQLFSLIVAVVRLILQAMAAQVSAGRIFIGHGRSHVWRQLQDFLERRLGFVVNEFNREPIAGISTSERLMGLLNESSFAFLVLTAEDTQLDESVRARENVVHETGLFQGRLGFNRAIVLLEEGCAEFSNIRGLTHIQFPRNDLEPAFEKIRGVLEREGLLNIASTSQSRF